MKKGAHLNFAMGACMHRYATAKHNPCPVCFSQFQRCEHTSADISRNFNLGTNICDGWSCFNEWSISAMNPWSRLYIFYFKTSKAVVQTKG